MVTVTTMLTSVTTMFTTATMGSVWMWVHPGESNRRKTAGRARRVRPSNRKAGVMLEAKAIAGILGGGDLCTTTDGATSMVCLPHKLVAHAAVDLHMIQMLMCTCSRESLTLLYSLRVLH